MLHLRHVDVRMDLASCAGLTVGKVAVSHVVNSMCWNRSIVWSPTASLAPFMSEVLPSLSTCDGITSLVFPTASRFLPAKQRDLPKVVLEFSHEAMKMGMKKLTVQLGRIADEMTQGTE